jgi:cytochrome c
MSKQDKEDARRWVKDAIAFYKACGKRIALAEFTNPKGPFIHEEKYIFVLNSNGTMLAHGVNERYLGEDFSELIDSDGKNFIKEMLDTANTQGYGWVEYKWYNPATKEVLPKTVYFEKVNDLIICSGVYEKVV